MPRRKRPGAPAPKRRSRNGCWPCKRRKIKCGEERPSCANCERLGQPCDYGIRLNWNGRGPRLKDNDAPDTRMENSLGSTNFQYGTENLTQNNPGSSQPGILIPDSYCVKTTTVVALDRPNVSHFRPQETVQSPRGIQRHPNEFSLSTDSICESLKNDISKESVFQGELSYASTSPPLYSTSTKEDISRDTLGGYQCLPRQHASHFDKVCDTENIDSAALFLGFPSINTASPDLASRQHMNSTIAAYTHDTSSRESLYPSNQQIIDPSFKTNSTNQISYMSVQSLLSGLPGIPSQGYNPGTQGIKGRIITTNVYGKRENEVTIWGIDHGLQDFDIVQKCDENAIFGDRNSTQENGSLTSSEFSPTEFDFGTRARDTSAEPHNYYARPVRIEIPNSLEPLPDALRLNPMNLLYFHFFITHTARVLIPHHCQSNPLIHLLPQMAIQDGSLLNLLLAYSAFHRARLLRYPVPSTRIALWVKDIFPTLREALNDPEKILSNTYLAIAIMLASLDIISPNAFECFVPWQQHLDIARQMIAARGGVKNMSRQDEVSYFLSRWFIYLDVIGSLSGGKSGLSSAETSWMSEDTVYDSSEDEYQIECFLGFTTRCATILSQIADLARQCDKARLTSNDSLNQPPSSDMTQEAYALADSLKIALTHSQKSCPNLTTSLNQTLLVPGTTTEINETLATNEAFHYAGLIHLYRRILQKKSSDPDVQEAVRRIMGLLEGIRKGGAAEGCLLFPIFTVGCEIGMDKRIDGNGEVGGGEGDEGLSEEEKGWRSEVLERMKRLEMGGMAHMKGAKRLMEWIWREGGSRCWVEVVEGGFFG